MSNYNEEDLNNLTPQGTGIHAQDKRVKWFGREIELEGVYYIYFSEQEKVMSDAQIENWNNIQAMPEKWRIREIAALNPDDNPHVIKVLGRALVEFSERGYMPQFDYYFDREHPITKKPSRRLVLVPTGAMAVMLEQRVRRKQRKKGRG